jgi:hypothetical protein
MAKEKSDKRAEKRPTAKPKKAAAKARPAAKAAAKRMARAKSAKRAPAAKPQAAQQIESAAAQASLVEAEVVRVAHQESAAQPAEASLPEPIAQPLTEPAQPAEPAREIVEGAELEGVQLPAIRGKVAIFGGPKDRGFKPDAKLALPTGRHFQYELVRSLNPNSYYCAMRWDYRQKHMSPEEGKRWWANKKLLVRNPANGRSVIVRAVDYGPHESTGLDIAISPGAAASIGVEIGDEVEIRFADQKAPLGPVHGEP